MRKLAVSAILAFGMAACRDANSPLTPRVSSGVGPPELSRGPAPGTPIPGQYIVMFRNDILSIDGLALQLATKHGGKLRHTYRSALKGMALELSDAAVAALRANPNVALVEQDQVAAIGTTEVGATWGIDRIDQHAMPLDGRYNYFADGTGVTVYIIDTGINFTHTEYAGRAFTGIDEVTPGGDAGDCNGHGSHVSGTVGGTTYGVAKNVRLVAVRVLDCAGSGSYSGVIAGIDWVTANRTLPAAANMSLGGGFSSILNQAVENSIAAGVTYAIAAGNSAADACSMSPASAPDAITVGATDNTDTFAYFSNFGSCVKIDAPGVNITSAWMGSTTATNTISGTSMATPHVAGTAALFLQANPSATPAQVLSALTSNATPGIITGVPSGTPNLLLYSAFIGGGPPPPPTPPVARFQSSCNTLACTFDGTGSTALASATDSWDFGDGAFGSGATTSHTYAAAGTYFVSLTVADANGTSTANHTVTVAPAPPPPPPVPTAAFTRACSGFNCNFDGSSSTGTGLTYGWAFGDTRTGTGVTTSHTFASRHTYTVKLTVTDATNATRSTSKTITCGRRSCS